MARISETTRVTAVSLEPIRTEYCPRLSCLCCHLSLADLTVAFASCWRIVIYSTLPITGSGILCHAPCWAADELYRLLSSKQICWHTYTIPPQQPKQSAVHARIVIALSTLCTPAVRAPTTTRLSRGPPKCNDSHSMQAIRKPPLG